MCIGRVSSSDCFFLRFRNGELRLVPTLWRRDTKLFSSYPFARPPTPLSALSKVPSHRAKTLAVASGKHIGVRVEAGKLRKIPQLFGKKADWAAGYVNRAFWVQNTWVCTDDIG